MKEIVMDLMCELSDMEINDRAQQLSSTLQRYDEVEIEKKNSNKQFSDMLSHLGGQSRKLSRAIRQRAEWRPVMCAVVFHSPVAGAKRIVRKDTGEIVKEEAMSQLEMQNNLFEDRDEATESCEPKPSAISEALASAIDDLAAPVREGGITSLTISTADQTVTIDKAAAERIHKRVKKAKQ